MVAVRLSHTSEVRKWRILVQVAGIIWEEIPSVRVGVFCYVTVNMVIEKL